MITTTITTTATTTATDNNNLQQQQHEQQFRVSIVVACRAFRSPQMAQWAERCYTQHPVGLNIFKKIVGALYFNFRNRNIFLKIYIFSK